MMDEGCTFCGEDNRSAATLLCEESQCEVCTVGVDPFERALTVLVRVGGEVREFSEPITHCPWCGREL